MDSVTILLHLLVATSLCHNQQVESLSQFLATIDPFFVPNRFPSTVPLQSNMPISTKHAFTLQVELAPSQDFGMTHAGARRFIPITGGTFQGDSIRGKILPGGGDWNVVRDDGVVEVYAKYTICTDDGTMILVTNMGWGRASQTQMQAVFGDDPASASLGSDAGASWYTKTSPRFEVARGSKYEWLAKAVFVGDLKPPTKPNAVTIEVYEVL